MKLHFLFLQMLLKSINERNKIKCKVWKMQTDTEKKKRGKRKERVTSSQQLKTILITHHISKYNIMSHPTTHSSSLGKKT